MSDPLSGRARLAGGEERLHLSRMKKTIENDARMHSTHIQKVLTDIMDHLRNDAKEVDEPRFGALLETAREVVKGLRRAFRDFNAAKERAFRVRGAQKRGRKLAKIRKLGKRR